MLREVRWVLGPGGRLVVFTATAELRCTPAAPEPIASALRFYTDAELVELAVEAGPAGTTVERPDLGEDA